MWPSCRFYRKIDAYCTELAKCTAYTSGSQTGANYPRGDMRLFEDNGEPKPQLLFYIMSDHCEILRVIRHNRLLLPMMICVTAWTNLEATGIHDIQKNNKERSQRAMSGHDALVWQFAWVDEKACHMREPQNSEIAFVQWRNKGSRAGLRGGQRWQLPRALRSKGGPRDDIYLF